jgi:hypothetical protein
MRIVHASMTYPEYMYSESTSKVYNYWLVHIYVYMYKYVQIYMSISNTGSTIHQDLYISMLYPEYTHLQTHQLSLGTQILTYAYIYIYICIENVCNHISVAYML